MSKTCSTLADLTSPFVIVMRCTFGKSTSIPQQLPPKLKLIETLRTQLSVICVGNCNNIALTKAAQKGGRYSCMCHSIQLLCRGKKIDSTHVTQISLHLTCQVVAERVKLGVHTSPCQNAPGCSMLLVLCPNEADWVRNFEYTGSVTQVHNTQLLCPRHLWREGHTRFNKPCGKIANIYVLLAQIR